MERAPIVDDARFLAGIRGERYAVLLARGDVIAACNEAQAALRERLAGLDIVYPRAHLTLASFARGTETREIQAALERWALGTAALTLRLDAITLFEPPPHAVVYARVAATGPLERGFARLRRETRARGLAPVAGERPTRLAEWIPHLSLAYCDRLDAPGWRRARDAAAELAIAPVECLVPVVELLTYEVDGEHLLASLPLRAGRAG